MPMHSTLAVATLVQIVRGTSDAFEVSHTVDQSSTVWPLSGQVPRPKNRQASKAADRDFVTSTDRAAALLPSSEVTQAFLDRVLDEKTIID